MLTSASARSLLSRCSYTSTRNKGYIIVANSNVLKCFEMFSPQTFIIASSFRRSCLASSASTSARFKVCRRSSSLFSASALSACKISNGSEKGRKGTMNFEQRNRGWACLSFRCQHVKATWTSVSWRVRCLAKATSFSIAFIFSTTVSVTCARGLACKSTKPSSQDRTKQWSEERRGWSMGGA